MSRGEVNAARGRGTGAVDGAGGAAEGSLIDDAAEPCSPAPPNPGAAGRPRPLPQTGGTRGSLSAAEEQRLQEVRASLARLPPLLDERDSLLAAAQEAGIPMTRIAAETGMRPADVRKSIDKVQRRTHQPRRVDIGWINRQGLMRWGRHVPPAVRRYPDVGANKRPLP